jgi:hypothetical protein
MMFPLRNSLRMTARTCRPAQNWLHPYCTLLRVSSNFGHHLLMYMDVTWWCVVRHFACVQESLKSQTHSHAMLDQETLLKAIKSEVKHRKEMDD